MRAWPDLPAEANVEAWLVTIAHRKAIDVTRSRQRHARPVDELTEPVSTVGVPGAEHLDMWAAVKSLPDKQRKAVAYRYLGGLAYHDIAELLGGTTDAARRAAADGIKTLRRTFAGAPSKGATR